GGRRRRAAAPAAAAGRLHAARAGRARGRADLARVRRCARGDVPRRPPRRPHAPRSGRDAPGAARARRCGDAARRACSSTRPPPRTEARMSELWERLTSDRLLPAAAITGAADRGLAVAPADGRFLSALPRTARPPDG